VAEIYQVEFKGSRREFFYNTFYHTLNPNEYVITEIEQGEDIGLIKAKIEDKEFDAASRPGSILRRASDEDLERYELLKENEKKYREEVIALVRRHGLVMKIVDVECRFDGSKITFFFTANHRVDFRALVRDLASRYRTRIELRQIGVRDEAKRMDGYGICGFRQCCNAYLSDFAPISTQHAREQDLSLNPAKISGNCGRLLCCLRFEVNQYKDVKKQFPPLGTVIKTLHGCGMISKIDVFNEEALFTNEQDAPCRVKASEIEKTLGKSNKASEVIIPTEETSLEDKRELDRLDEDEHN